MKLLISGTEGFIASHLADRLATKHTVLGLDKKQDSSTADLRLLELLVLDFKPDMIVHLGANCSSQISLRDPVTDFTDNVVGTFNVCEIARKFNIPVIFNSTMKVYPGEDELVPPYGLSKTVGEDYIKLFHQLYGVEYIINRPSSVYGPRQDGSEDGGWFTWFIKASLLNEPITLFGDGTQSRDVLYIDDCIDLLVDQIENFDLYKNQEFDFGGGLENEVSLNGLLEKLDYPNTAMSDKLPGDVQRFVAGYAEVSAINGWAPKIGWLEGLERTRAWLRQSLLSQIT